jgi:hypothetical protein
MITFENQLSIKNTKSLNQWNVDYHTCWKTIPYLMFPILDIIIISSIMVIFKISRNKSIGVGQG